MSGARQGEATAVPMSPTSPMSPGSPTSVTSATPGQLVPQSRPLPRARGHLLFGQWREACWDTVPFFESLLGYGDAVRLRFWHCSYTFVTHPLGVAQVLRQTGTRYDKATSFYQILARALGEGLVNADGLAWKAQRQAAQPFFHGEALSGVAALAAEEAEALASRLRSAGRLDAAPELSRASLSVAARSLFGLALSAEEAGEVHQAVDAVQRQVNARVMGDPTPEWVPTLRHRRFKRGMRALDRLAERAQAQPSGLLGALQSVAGVSLRDQVVTLLMAGHETVANTLAWALSLLAQHPEAQAQVREEARQVGPARSAAERPRGAEAVRRLSYARQVVEETLRLYPPLYLMTRRAVEDDVVCGYHVPKGTMLMVSPYVSQRHPEFFEAPSAFRPERFAGAGGEPWRAAYQPFGAGPRACIGRGLALLELPAMLAALCGQLAFALDGPAPEPEALITLRPRGGLRLQVTEA